MWKARPSPSLLLLLPALVAACSAAGATSLEGSDPISASEPADASAPTPVTTPSTVAPAASTAAPAATTPAPIATTSAPVDNDAAAPDDASTAISCPYSGTPLDTSKFTSCGAEAVCAPTGLIPPASVSDFATCATGLCVPSKVLAAYGNYLPATCRSLENAEGRCLNTVLPSVVPQVNELPQATCDTNERCVPCFDPLDGTSTGACSTVSCDAPKEAAVTFAGCCFSGATPAGRCVPASAAGSSASSLSSGGCTGDNLCAPAENLQPNFAPQFCSGTVDLFFDYTGFCVSNCIPNDSGLDQGDCDGAHYCAPCHDPFSGDPTNVPGCVY